MATFGKIAVFGFPICYKTRFLFRAYGQGKQQLKFERNPRMRFRDNRNTDDGRTTDGRTTYGRTMDD